MLQRRVALLEEYLDLLVKAAALVEQKQGLGKRLQQAKTQLTRLEQAAAPAQPESPSKEAFEKLTAMVTAQRDQVSALRNTISARNQWLESAPRQS